MPYTIQKDRPLSCSRHYVRCNSTLALVQLLRVHAGVSNVNDVPGPRDLSESLDLDGFARFDVADETWTVKPGHSPV